MNAAVLVALALLTGALVPLQLAFNGQLGTALRSPYLGACGVFVIGTLSTMVLLILVRSPLPSPTDLKDVPVTAWIGGLIATAYIVAIVFLVPKLGVGVTAILIIAGQIVVALALDHFGAFGAPQDPLTAARSAGAALVLAGAALVKLA
ncbi:MAG: DMT family transporter [Silicimonas sp.]|uniref:DMT family transporter n=1 Tax=Roseitalea porphyridii TaxID=1852022 RepID=UPI0032EA98C9